MRELEGKWKGIHVLFEVSPGGGYDWQYCALLMRELSDGRREYASYVDSGCSCSWEYEMSPDFYDISWSTDLLAVERAVVQGISEVLDSYMSSAERVSSMAKLRRVVFMERGRVHG